MKLIPDLLLLIYLYIKLSKSWNNKETKILNTIMFVYLSFVLFFTLMPIISSLPFIFTHSYKWMSLELFGDFFYQRGDYIRQIVLNIILMLPFGFIYPFIIKDEKNKFIKTITRVFLFSLCIELIQPLVSSYRISDITDIITNTTGGILGFVLYKIFEPISIKLLNELK